MLDRLNRFFAKLDWTLWVPVVCWGLSLWFGYSKIDIRGEEVAYSYLDYLDVFNSNTFSTFFSLVLVMIILYMSANGQRDQESRSGLRRDRFLVTCIATFIYFCIAAADGFKASERMAVVMTAVSAIYVFLFFVSLRAPKSQTL